VALAVVGLLVVTVSGDPQRPGREHGHAGGVPLRQPSIGPLASAQQDGQPKPLPTEGTREKDGKDRGWTAPERLDSLKRARFWQKPAVPIERAALDRGPHDYPPELTCRFIVTSLDGTTPKFECTLESGQEIKVKYGKGPELHGEVAATRLTRALGFGADSVAFVERVKCYGCPRFPFVTMKTLDALHSAELYESVVNFDDHVDFKWVAVERRFKGDPITVGGAKGFGLFELEQLDGRPPGAPRAHVDALRLLAVFLAHWDNKAENQRLVCLDDTPAGGPCEKPFGLLQDLGATFGPYKVDVDGWKHAPFWKDRASCTVTMETLPYNGATFRPLAVTEGGRRLLASMLTRLTDTQIEALFKGARFHEYTPKLSPSRPLADWVTLFKQRVRLVADGTPCPQ
jgi:hypothetical protein